MSDADPGAGEPHIPTRGVSSTPKPPTPKAIAAQSQAWNSAAKIVVLGIAILSLLVLARIALFQHPEALRDLLWAAVTAVAYLAGSTEAARKDEK